jgi:hypothetical protein
MDADAKQRNYGHIHHLTARFGAFSTSGAHNQGKLVKFVRGLRMPDLARRGGTPSTPAASTTCNTGATGTMLRC